MPVKYHIRLSTEEQQSLQQVVRAKKIARYKRTHAQILLTLDENDPALSESETAATCVISHCQQAKPWQSGSHEKSGGKWYTLPPPKKGAIRWW